MLRKIIIRTRFIDIVFLSLMLVGIASTVLGFRMQRALACGDPGHGVSRQLPAVQPAELV